MSRRKAKSKRKANRKPKATVSTGRLRDVQQNQVQILSVEEDTHECFKAIVRDDVPGAFGWERTYDLEIRCKDNLFEVWSEGNRMFRNLSHARLMWEYDGFFVSVRDAGIEPTAFTIPDDLKSASN